MCEPRLVRDETAARPSPWPHEPNERSATGKPASAYLPLHLHCISPLLPYRHLRLHRRRKIFRERHPRRRVIPTRHEELHHRVPAIAPRRRIISKLIPLRHKRRRLCLRGIRLDQGHDRRIILGERIELSLENLSLKNNLGKLVFLLNGGFALLAGAVACFAVARLNREPIRDHDHFGDWRSGNSVTSI
jgi:hypothetical protein